MIILGLVIRKWFYEYQTPTYSFYGNMIAIRHSSEMISIVIQWLFLWIESAMIGKR
jgi:hypothetical protein